jgi:hypothetical protein
MRRVRNTDQKAIEVSPRLPMLEWGNHTYQFNLKAAKQIGLTMPPNVLARADRVIR